MKRITTPVLVLFWLSSTVALGQDESDDRAAILALMDKAFAAVASGDPDDWRPLLIEEARSLDFLIRPDGNASPRERS